MFTVTLFIHYISLRTLFCIGQREQYSAIHKTPKGQHVDSEDSRVRCLQGWKTLHCDGSDPQDGKCDFVVSSRNNDRDVRIA